jgi:hypothetical protein
VARVYTAVSKHVNHQLRKHEGKPIEIEIPYFGSVIKREEEKLEFQPS